MTAAPSLTELFSQVPELNEHTVAPPALAPLRDIRVLEKQLREIVSSGSPDARAYAALGNVLARRDLYLEARDAYLAAVQIDERFAAAHIAIAELSSLLRDEARARTHLLRALSLARRYDDPLPVDARRQLLLLLRDDTYARNAPLELLIDRSRIAVHKLYVGEMPSESPPPHDVAICAFGASSEDDGLASTIGVLMKGQSLLNRPSAIAACARERLPEALRDCDGILCVQTVRVAADGVQHIDLPALVRPAGTHAGMGLALVTNIQDLHQHVARFRSESYHVSPFIDYRSDDGYYRKYRIVIVGGRAFPYHLAVSPRAIVHYLSSPMREHEWMREEEATFLAHPESVFPQWQTMTTSLARALALDYVGLDVTRLPDGRMLVFEADPAMLVHDEDERDVFAYKRPYVALIRNAFERRTGYAKTP